MAPLRSAAPADEKWRHVPPPPGWPGNQGNIPLADQYDELGRLSANAELLRARLEMVTAMASIRSFLDDMGLDDEDLEF